MVLGDGGVSRGRGVGHLLGLEPLAESVTPTEATLVAMLALSIVVVFVLAAAETALLRVRPSAVVVEAEAGDRRSDDLLRLLDDLPRVLNAVLLTVLFSQVTVATIAGVLAQRWLGSGAVTVATVLVTLVLFVYGEAIPKTFAVRQPLLVARRLAVPIRWLSIVSCRFSFAWPTRNYQGPA